MAEPSRLARYGRARPHRGPSRERGLCADEREILLLIICAILGAFIGWIASLITRSDSNGAIYLAITAGATGGVLGPLVEGLNSAMDSVLASAMSASALVAVLAIAEKAIGRCPNRSAEQRLDEQRQEVSDHSTEREQTPAEEHLRVSSSEVEAGGASVRSYLKERPVSEEITLREEHVSVERRPVRGSDPPADLENSELLQDRRIEMPETSEEAVAKGRPLKRRRSSRAAMPASSP